MSGSMSVAACVGREVKSRDERAVSNTIQITHLLCSRHASVKGRSALMTMLLTERVRSHLTLIRSAA